MPVKFEFQDMPATTASTFTMSLGDTVYGQIAGTAQNLDRDFIRITLEQGQQITLGAIGVGPYDERLTSPIAVLRNAAGTQVTENVGDFSNPHVFSDARTYTIQQDGTYFIDVVSEPIFARPPGGYYGVTVTEGTKASFSDAMAVTALNIDGASWSAAAETPATVTYGFRKTAPVARDENDDPLPAESTFQQISDIQKDGIRKALKAWSDVANITFVEVADADGYTDDATILFQNYSAQDGAGAYSTGDARPENNGVNSSGDIYFNSLDLTQPIEGSAFYLAVHEIGHSIGLSHPGDYNAELGVSFTYDADSGFLEDNWRYSLMSYFDESSGNEPGEWFFTRTMTPMMWDIAAVQALYGAKSLHAGDTVYGAGTGLGLYEFDPDTGNAMSIYDSGGIDTIDASFHDGAQRIDLAPGAFSSIGFGLNNVSIFSNPYNGIETIIEKAIGGSGEDHILGNAVENTLIGGDGDDILDGRGGQDTLFGGKGDDTYDNVEPDDIVSEKFNEGTDTMLVRFDHMLVFGTSIEVLGAAATAGDIDLTGNSAVQTLRGNDDDNVLNGAGGADTLEGKGGSDTYIINNAGIIIKELSAPGHDTIIVGFTYTVADGVDVEEIRSADPTATTALNLAGNEKGQKLIGNAGANTLSDGGGNATLVGLGGGDLYQVSGFFTTIDEVGGGGTDRVHVMGNSFQLNQNAAIEFIYAKKAGASITGNNLFQTIQGLSGNETFDGGGGADLITGGAGDDTYKVGDGSVRIVERAREGNDTVVARVDFTLAAGIWIETLEVEQFAVNSGSIIRLTGNAFDQVMVGAISQDTLDSGGGADDMSGGSYSDTYIVRDGRETVHEAANITGTDTIRTYVDWTLGADLADNDIEVLTGEFARAGLTLNGNALGQTIIGSVHADIIDGGGGGDDLFGGKGSDIYYINHASDQVTENDREGDDTVYAKVNHSLLEGQSIERLIAQGTGASTPGFLLKGNALAQEIMGAAGADTLDGKGGLDTLKGLAGGDRYIAGTGVKVIEAAGEGFDTVFATSHFTLGAGQEVEALRIATSPTPLAIDLTGNELAQQIVGNAANNRLTGGGGADTLSGLEGDDTYVVSSDARVFEAAGKGFDTVFTRVDHTLQVLQEIEALSALDLLSLTPLKLKGNTFAQTITGNAGDNELDGGGGLDTLAGGKGDDIYRVGEAGVVVLEGIGGGDDTILTSVSHTLIETSAVEDLRAADPASTKTLVLGGNPFDQTIVGNAGVNELSGGGGFDLLEGLGGHDTYFVDGNDTVIEQAGGGTDIVRASAHFVLGEGAEVETLETFSASSDIKINLTGNAIGQALTGNMANNVLDGRGGQDVLTGGRGVDVLTGGEGADRFVFADGDTVDIAAGFDTIVDFLSGIDRIDLPFAVAETLYEEGAVTSGNTTAYAAMRNKAIGMMADGLTKVAFVAGTLDGWLFWDTDGALTTPEAALRLTGLTSLDKFAWGDLM